MSSKGSKGRIKVIVRIRGGAERHDAPLIQSADRTIQMNQHQFTFDQVAHSSTTNDEMFLSVGQDAVDACLRGYNASMFCYGQTASGKTYTIQGGLTPDGDIIHEQRGMVPLALEYLFGRIRSSESQMSVRCSFLEIYQEAITDLLNPGSHNLPLRLDVSKGCYVAGLREQQVDSAAAALDLLSFGSRNRHVGWTAMNSSSSRSHSVFSIKIQSKQVKNGVTSVKCSRLSFIDLAGSERQAFTQAKGVRLQEASVINKSLSQLGLVIRALSSGVAHVPYRDSKLTMLLKDSLGGNSKTTIIATVSPDAQYFGETLSTLRFAARAKNIKNHAIINEQAVGGNVHDLQREIMRLKNELQEVKESCAREPAAQQAEAVSVPHATQRCVRNALTQVELVMKENSALQDQLDQLRALESEKSERLERLLKSTTLKLKLREDALKGSYTAPETVDKVPMLEMEISALQDQLDHNPEVIHYAVQNLELQEELEEYQRFFGEEAKQESVQELMSLRELVADLTDQLKSGGSINANEEELLEELAQLRAKVVELSLEVEVLQSTPVSSNLQGLKDRLANIEMLERGNSEATPLTPLTPIRQRARESFEALVLSPFAGSLSTGNDSEERRHRDRQRDGLSKAKREIATMSAHITELQERLASEKVNVSQLNSQLEAEREVIDGLQEEREFHATQISDLMQRVARGTQKSAEANLRVEGLQSKLEHIGVGDSEVRQENVRLEGELANLQREQKQDKQIIGELRKELRAAAESLESAANFAKQKGDRVQALQSQIAAQTEESLKQNELIAFMREQIEDLKENNATSASNLQEELRQLKEDMVLAEQDLEATQRMLAQKHNELDDQRSETMDFEMRLNKKEQEIVWLKREFNEMEEEKIEWMAQMRELKRKEEESWEKNKQNEAEISQLSEQLQEARSDLQFVKGERDKLRVENADMMGHQNRKQKIKHVEKVKSENNKLKERVQLLERHLQKSRRLNKALSEQTDSQKAEDIMQEMERLTREVTNLTQERNAISQLVGSSAICDRLVEMKNLSTERERTLEVIRGDNALLNKEITILRRKRAAPLTPVNK